MSARGVHNEGVPKRHEKTLLMLTLDRALTKWAGLDPEQGRASLWVTTKLLSPVGRLGAFMVAWAIVMEREGLGEKGELSPEVFWTHGFMSRASTYRRKAEYEELWPDVEINEMGRKILGFAGDRVASVRFEAVVVDVPAGLAVAAA